MSVSPEDIAASRALRDEARAIVTAHIGEVRADLSPQTIGQRIKHKASEQAVEMIDETRAVASDNKLVIGGNGGDAGWLVYAQTADRPGPPHHARQEAGTALAVVR